MTSLPSLGEQQVNSPHRAVIPLTPRWPGGYARVASRSRNPSIPGHKATLGARGGQPEGAGQLGGRYLSTETTRALRWLRRAMCSTSTSAVRR